VTRFIGTSKDSYNIQSILYSIIEELSIEYYLDIDQIQLSADRIYDYFKAFLIKTASLNQDTMFYFILDSLDQLEEENDARKLGWLPIVVPSNIRFIVSTLIEDEYEAYPILFSTFSSTQRNNFILVSDLTDSDLNNLIEKRLDSIQNYNLKDKIQEFLNFNFKNNRKHCLHVKLILDVALKLTPFTDFDNLLIPNTAEYAIEYIFQKIETKFQKDFVRIAIRYLTLSRKGIYFDDWIKLLSKMFKNPNFALLELINELNPYLLSSPLYRWYHRKFSEISKRLYCYDIDNECAKSHKMVVDTFSKEVFDINDRFWITELPYHAIYTKDIEMVKEKFLLNLEFMKIKIKIVGLDELNNDYMMAIKVFNDESLRIIHSCLIASSNLRVNSNSLTSQLLGRIPRNYINLAPFVEKCILLCEKAVIPNKKYLSLEINQSTTKNIKLHNKPIVYVALTNNKQHLIINTIDKIIKIFSINDLGIERSKFERFFTNTQELLISSDDNFVYAIGKEKSENKEFSEGIIEAFDIVNKIRGFSIRRLDNTFVEHHAFALANNYLIILTNKLCYKMNCKNGGIIEKYELPDKWPSSVVTQVSIKHNLLAAQYFGLSKLLFGNKNYKFTYYDFGEYFVRGKILFLQNSNILLPMRKDFKTKFNYDTIIWKLVTFNVEKMKVEKQIRMNKALQLFGVSSDDNFVYGFCYSYLYCLDIRNDVLVYSLEHYVSIYSAFTILDDKRIISSSKGNYICIYDTDKSNHSNDSDPYSGYNSREVKFIMDDFSSRCPLLLAYNIFEKSEKEIYLFYDILDEKIIKKLELEEFFQSYEPYDFNPLSLISSKAVFVESLRHRTYYLISIKDLKVAKKFKILNKRIFKRISYSRFLISHCEFNQEKLSLFEIQDASDAVDCVLTHDVLFNLESIDWFLINQVNFIYKARECEEINVYDLTQKQNEKIKLDSKANINSNNIFSSPNGRYFVFYDSSENEMLCFINPDHDEIIIEKCTCFLNKKNKIYCPSNVYNVTKHSDSKYIWIQTLLYPKSELVVYDMNELSEAVCRVDTETKLRINAVQNYLLDIKIGNYFLTKDFEKINFIIFYLKDKQLIRCSNFIKDLFDEIRM